VRRGPSRPAPIPRSPGLTFQPLEGVTLSATLSKDAAP